MRKKKISRQKNRVRASNTTAENPTGRQHHWFKVNSLRLGPEYIEVPKDNSLDSISFFHYMHPPGENLKMTYDTTV